MPVNYMCCCALVAIPPHMSEGHGHACKQFTWAPLPAPITHHHRQHKGLAAQVQRMQQQLEQQQQEHEQAQHQRQQQLQLEQEEWQKRLAEVQQARVGARTLGSFLLPGAAPARCTACHAEAHVPCQQPQPACIFAPPCSPPDMSHVCQLLAMHTLSSQAAEQQAFEAAKESLVSEAQQWSHGEVDAVQTAMAQQLAAVQRESDARCACR